jgi:hypothetical protein
MGNAVCGRFSVAFKGLPLTARSTSAVVAPSAIENPRSKPSLYRVARSKLFLAHLRHQFSLAGKRHLPPSQRQITQQTSFCETL